MNTFPSRETVEYMKARYPEGTRVRLVKMEDMDAVPKGTLGTVLGVDAIGSLLIRWDNGRSLNVLYGIDVVTIVTEEEEDPYQFLIGQKVKNDLDILDSFLYESLQLTGLRQVEEDVFEGKLPNRNKLLIHTQVVDESGKKIKILKISLR
jgi:hypothetical protein